MLSWNLADVAKAVHAKNEVANIKVTSVSFDSRQLEEGALFVPLMGENDGHDYIQSAIEKGARACFWSRDVTSAPDGIEVIQVEDTHQALKDFAKSYLKSVSPTVVAITGSNGKTTSKDMTAAVLSKQYRTHKTAGNFNNDIGMPMTILAMPRDTQVLVLEMGMNHAGEISELSQLAQPDLAVITMVGESHIEYLGSRQGIAEAKFEIVDGLQDEGCLFYDGDEDLLRHLVEARHVKSQSFGKSCQNSIYPLSITSKMDETQFVTNLDSDLVFSIPLPGEYNVNNALAAISVGLALDVDLELAREALKDFKLTANRLEWLDGVKGSRLLNDAYNASPTSMKASVKSFSQLDLPGRKGVVLGDMGELGQYSADYHRGIGEAIQEKDFDYIYLYGPEMAVLYDELVKTIDSCDVFYVEHDQDELVRLLKDTLQNGDHILFKSSFSTNLIAVVDALKADEEI